MSQISPEQREQALRVIQLYCKRPYRDHGKKRDSGPYKGWHLHDWGHVVQRVYWIFYALRLEIPSASLAAKPVRAEFPNKNNWEKNVGSPHAQTRMLKLIEEGLAPFAPTNRQPTNAPPA